MNYVYTPGLYKYASLCGNIERNVCLRFPLPSTENVGAFSIPLIAERQKFPRRIQTLTKIFRSLNGLFSNNSEVFIDVFIVIFYTYKAPR